MQHEEGVMVPLVSLIIGLFVACSATLAGLLFADRRAERRRNPTQASIPESQSRIPDRELTARA